MANGMNGTRNDCTSASDVYVVGAARTPIGAFMGALASVPVTDLGAVAIKGAVQRSGIPLDAVEEVVMGHVVGANAGQCPGRQAAIRAGLPDTVVSSSVNKVCASGLKAIIMAAQSIMLGQRDVCVAGGMESMSGTPYYIAKARSGYRLGNGELVDGLQKDGLVDAYEGVPMGVFAEQCAERHGFTRENQDDFSVTSCERAIAADRDGAFQWEIVPVEVKGGKGKPSMTVAHDEQYSKFDAVKLRSLRPCFVDGGTVTAGNSSGINDGAAAVVLASHKAVREHGLTPLAVVRGFGEAEQAPPLFTTTPALALPRALSHAGLVPADVDFWEINEAFAVVALANTKLLGIPPETVNVHGGSVALGHPLGCSGARIIVTLLGVLRRRGGRVGAAGVCNGGGGASALVMEACDGLIG